MKLLAIFAHPDDEAYGPGATLARYAVTGHEVALVTLTRGEAGSMGICKTLSPEEVAEMRTRELKCAAKALKLSYLNIYDLPDKALENYPAEKGIEIVKQEIESLQPHVVITFHPRGISGHPDHITVSNWCRNAIQQISNPPHFFYYGISPEQAEKIKPYRQVIPFAEGEITHIIDASTYFPYKLNAIQCHASQLELWEKFKKIGNGTEYFSKREHFSRAYPPLKVSQPLTDLFSEN